MSQQDELIQYYGVMTQLYGNAWPELKSIMMTIYRDKVSKVPWLPSDWLEMIENLNDVSGNVVVVVPSTANYAGGVGPSFLDTVDKKVWWDQLASAASSAVQKYASGKAADGKKQLDQLYASSDFWSRAYDWAVILASPVTAVRAAWNNPYTTATLAVGVGLLVWLVTRATGKRGKKS